jgi:NodT family efflux transporter outer membrane factor (OMF) lipoprotein
MMTTMLKKRIYRYLGLAGIVLSVSACTPDLSVKKTANTAVPEAYKDSQDTTNTAKIKWRDYFTDPNLIALIDTALSNNQELNITLQEIEIARNEVRARKGEYLPFVGVGAGAGADKVGRYTRNGALEANNEIKPGKEFPEPLGDFTVGAYATWEVDIWHKLRTAKKSAYQRYLSSVEGKNFMVTNLIAEIANSYYELLALDNQLAIVKQNIEIQTNALEIVKLQKQSARVTELAVRRFEAQVLDTRSLQFDIQQMIIETENRINFLVGRYPQDVPREAESFSDLVTGTIQEGIPSQLLQNRPDIRQAELELAAAKLDIKSAKANFYPSLGISAGIGYQAFNPTYLLTTPESLLYYMGGDLAAPLINRRAIKATYYNANAKQIQAVYNYERTILNAYIEVANQLSNIGNLQNSYELKSSQVQALTESVEISTTLFRAARADYMEVLLTQRDALETRFELVETKMRQMHAKVNIYQALGGGWN